MEEEANLLMDKWLKEFNEQDWVVVKDDSEIRSLCIKAVISSNKEYSSVQHILADAQAVYNWVKKREQKSP